MDIKYLQHLALADISSVYSYKILLLLNIKEYTQSQLSEILNLQKQNTLKYVKELESMKLIEVSRIEGRNKFFKAVTDMKTLKELIPGQLKI